MFPVKVRLLTPPRYWQLLSGILNYEKTILHFAKPIVFHSSRGL